MGGSMKEPTIIVTGIGTGVGKTLVSAILAQLLGAAYWKPIGSGLPGDSARVAHLTQGIPILPPDYLFPDPISPHAASLRVGVEIETDKLVPPDVTTPLIIEGAGGVCVPLRGRILLADLFKEWQALWIVVSRHYLGSINHTLLTLEALAHRGIKPLGLIFNGEEQPSTEEAICEQSEVRCVGRLEQAAIVNREMVRKYCIQWEPLSQLLKEAPLSSAI